MPEPVSRKALGVCPILRKPCRKGRGDEVLSKESPTVALLRQFVLRDVQRDGESALGGYRTTPVGLKSVYGERRARKQAT